MTSDSFEKLTEALLAFHEEVEPVQKNAESSVGTRAYRYADLAAVWDAIRQPLVNAGLVLIQTVEPTELVQCTPTAQAWARLHTRLQHRSGQWVESTVPLVADWSNPQRFGSAMTYMRRYTILGLLGLAPEDDDGAAARAVPARREERPRYQPPPRHNGYPRPVNGNGYHREPTEDEILDRIAAEQAGREPGADATPPKPRRPAPRTGVELDDYARTCKIDPGLVLWIREHFARNPHRPKDWTDAQVMAAWPEIRAHLMQCKAQRDGAPVNGAAH